jgi:hypothetical protein
LKKYEFLLEGPGSNWYQENHHINFIMSEPDPRSLEKEELYNTGFNLADPKIFTLECVLIVV